MDKGLPENTTLGLHPEGAAGLLERLRHDVAEGYLAEQGRLPSERSLSEMYGVPRGLVRAAVSQLEKEGVLYRLARAGTFLRTHGRVRPEQKARLRCVTVVQNEWAERRPSVITIRHLAGFSDALDGHEVRLRFVVLPEGEPTLDCLLHSSIPPEEQGFILDYVDSPPLFDLISGHGLPFVLQFPFIPPSSLADRFHWVGINRAGGFFEATRHLASLGHRRIGFVGDVFPHGDHYADAFEGYRAALVALGVPWDPSLLVQLITEEADTAAAAVGGLLDRPDRPTAVLARCDGIAFGVVRAAQAMGLSVPEDLSVVGFNDMSEAARFRPPLTTIAPPRRAAGRAAAEMLLAVASGTGNTKVQSRAMNCQLIVRASTAAPPEPRDAALAAAALISHEERE